MLRKFREILKNKQRGAIMVFFAILVPLFLGAIGLAVDAGFLYMQKAKLQDVADATALAGAGHLKDENREEQVAKAVSAFAGANGYKDKDEAASSNFSPLGDNVPDSNVTLEENAAWKIAYAIDTGMEDKDAKKGELRDHVRVVILKRVPTFFIRMLFPEQKEVVVKAVAAAEYVAGEEQPVDYDGAKIFGGQVEQDYSSSNSIVLDNGTDFSMFAGSGIKNDKVPAGSVGTFYGPEWQPKLPAGWSSVRLKENWYEWDSKEEKEAYEKMISLIDKKINQYSSESKKLINEKNKYINKEGNKRYIGFDPGARKIINNIVKGDDDIELYMDGTFANVEQNQYNVVLTNGQLRGVKTVKKLIFGQETEWGYADHKFNIIATKNISYGDIYGSPVGARISLSGEKNHFNGLVYSPSQILIGGYDNYFNESGKTELFACHPNGYHIYDGIVKIGLWDKAIESIDASGNINITMYWGQNESWNSSWQMHWGNGSSSGGSSSGSSGSGATKAHVRLVI